MLLKIRNLANIYYINITLILIIVIISKIYYMNPILYALIPVTAFYAKNIREVHLKNILPCNYKYNIFCIFIIIYLLIYQHVFY